MIARSGRLRLLPVAALAIAFFAACRVGGRQGRPFDEVFPDASVLVTTNDPVAVRAQLATAQLPATREHHDRLLALLRAQPQVRAANLALLTRAVATAPFTNISVDGVFVHMYGERGKGEFAPVIEQLLTEGIERVTDVDRRWFGELIGMTQTDATLRLWADRFLAGVDDGSPEALGEVLDGMRGSPATMPFLVGYLAPKGGLGDERGWLAFTRVSFDNQRTELLDLLVSRGAAIDGDRMVATMRAFSFDEGREHAFALLAGRTKPLSIDHVQASLATFSFDSGRDAAFAVLAEQSGVHLTDRHLVDLVRMCSFDSAKLQCVKALAPRLEGAPDGADARALLAAFSFDSGREQAFAAMCTRWAQLPAKTYSPLVATFSFDAGRSAAFALLGAQPRVRLTDHELVELVRLCSFDDGKLTCVQTFAPRLEGEPSAADARALLAAFSFDPQREQAVAAMRSRWIQMPANTHATLLATFSFDASRERAARLLRP